METNNIKEKINLVINKCKEEDLYLQIISDFFKQGITKISNSLESLKILPNKNERVLKENFEKNIKIIINSIENEIKPGLIIYNVLSCIYGSFYGDALGAFYMFSKDSKNIQKNIYKIPYFNGEKGQATNDYEIAMSLAYAIMDNPSKESLDPNYLYFYYGAWSTSNPLRIENTIKNALSKFNFNQFLPNKTNFKYIENEIYKNNNNSLSNRFLMRKSTFIIWIFYRFYGEINIAFNEISDNKPLLDLYLKIKNLSHLDNICTHPNAITDIVSSFYCIMGLGILYGLRAKNILHKIECLCEDEYFKKKGDEKEKNFSNFFLSHFNTINSRDFDFSKFFGVNTSKNCVNNKDIGWYGHAFLLTIYYLLNYDNYESESGFIDIMNEICNLGGDIEANCCIVGGIIGPIFGMSNFGKHFFSSLECIPSKRYIYSIALMVPYIIYLKKSNKDIKLIQNERYFLQTILTLLYDKIELDFS